MCSNCGEMILISRKLASAPDDDRNDHPAGAWPRTWGDQSGQLSKMLSEPRQLGLLALAMGLLAILLMCLPQLGYYAGLVLSGSGLLLCLIGLIQVIMGRGRGLIHLLGGSSVCLLAILLIMLPRLWK
ncbi:MAG: hypothetical protein ACJ8FY_15100 [Gemmataceae bacterium]